MRSLCPRTHLSKSAEVRKFLAHWVSLSAKQIPPRGHNLLRRGGRQRVINVQSIILNPEYVHSIWIFKVGHRINPFGSCVWSAWPCLFKSIGLLELFNLRESGFMFYGANDFPYSAGIGDEWRRILKWKFLRKFSCEKGISFPNILNFPLRNRISAVFPCVGGKSVFLSSRRETGKIEERQLRLQSQQKLGKDDFL